MIARAAALLRALGDKQDGLSLGELSVVIGLPRSTIQRIVNALVDEGLVMSASPGRGVRLGPALLSLASSAQFRIADIARPFLLELSRECGETVDLSQLDGNGLVFLDQIEGDHHLRAESGIGVRFALHSTAPGKAMLAMMTGEELQRMRPRLELNRLTRHTVRSWPVLLKELARIRDTGLALDLEENTLGICAQAVAIRLPTGSLAAISVSVPTQRFDDQKQRVAELLSSAGTRLHRMLGSERSL